MIDFCKKTTENDWNLIEDEFKYGIFIKKQQYLKIATEPKAEGTIRTKLVQLSYKLQYSEDSVEFIMSKSLPIKDNQ